MKPLDKIRDTFTDICNFVYILLLLFVLVSGLLTGAVYHAIVAKFKGK